MKADLDNIKLNSSFFASILKREKTVSGIKDETLYLFTTGNKEFEKAAEACPLPIKIAGTGILIEDTELQQLMEQKYNLLMPVSTPDRKGKCYLAGSLNNPSDLAPAYTYLSMDAQKIYQECSFADFVTLLETDMQKAKAKWLSIIQDAYYERTSAGKSFYIGSDAAHRGINRDAPISEFTFFGKGYEKSLKLEKFKYDELVSNLKKFPYDITPMKKSLPEEFTHERKLQYIRICESMRPVEKNHLILELFKRIEDNTILSEAIKAVMEKEEQCTHNVKVDYSTDEDVKQRIYRDIVTCLIGPNEQRKVLNLSPNAHIIYIMTLMHRKKYPNGLSNMKIEDNESAFLTIYNEFYGNNKGSEMYKKITQNEDKKHNKLKDCYREITNCINTCCLEMGEAPSPYLVTAEKPLTLKPEMISINFDSPALNTAYIYIK